MYEGVIPDAWFTRENLRYFGSYPYEKFDLSTLPAGAALKMLWPPNVTTEYMALYLGTTELGIESSVCEILRYFVTFDTLCSAREHLLSIVEIIYGFTDSLRRKDIVYMNLHMISTLSVEDVAASIFYNTSSFDTNTHFERVMQMNHRLFMLCCKAASIIASVDAQHLTSLADPDELLYVAKDAETTARH